MRLVSVNLSTVRELEGVKSVGMTGIYKQPIGAPVHIHTLGVTGDAVCDTKHHGGPDQAVYIFGTPDYEWWSRELGQDLAPGTFGENLTVEGLESAAALIGDRLHIGSAVLEVTGPRIPCATLAYRMDDPQFIKRFRDAERPGLYCRVIQEGELQAGEPVRYETYTGQPAVLSNDFYRDFFNPDMTEAAIQRFLDAPIAIRAREFKERQLASLRR